MKKNQNWNMPNLKEAKQRTKKETVIEKSLFNIPAEVKNIGVGRKFFLRTYGCQANERDGETIAGILEALNFTQVRDVEDADLILLNTCAVRKNAEDKVLGELGQLKRLRQKNPDLIYGLCGCMAQEEDVVETIVKKYKHVDLVFGTHNIHRLPILLYQVLMEKERTIEVFSKEGDVIENLPVKRFGTHKAWVNIMYGCDKFCTYCIVPYTRGKERSRKSSQNVGGHGGVAMREELTLSMAVKKIAWGYILIHSAINLGVVDILPDWLGYYFMLVAIRKIQEEEESVGLLEPLAKILIVWNVLVWGTKITGWNLSLFPFAIVINVIGIYFHFQ